MCLSLCVFRAAAGTWILHRDGMVLLSRHKDVGVGAFSPSVLTTGIENPDTPEAKPHRILGSVDPASLRFESGQFELQLAYGYPDGTTDTLRWTQRSWITESSVDGVDLFGVDDDNRGVPGKGFGGLTKSTSTRTYLDGSSGHSDDWWHSVATVTPLWGGLPGHEEKLAVSSELWALKGAALGCVVIWWR